MNIRPYADADRDDILRLHRELHAHEVPLRPQRSRSEAVSERYIEHEYEELMGDPECDCMFLVAEDGANIVGYVFCLVDHELLDDPMEQVQVLDIVVTKSARKRGIGRRLMAEVDRFADERGIARISLMVLAANEDALSFYRTLGFDTAVLMMERIGPTKA